MTDQQEELAQTIDTLDNLASALSMPLPDRMHVEQLRMALPRLVTDMQQAFVALTGENPWEDE